MKVAEKLVPELRFPEYEDKWEIKKLKAVLRNSRTKGGNSSLAIFSVTQAHGLVPRNSLDRKMADCANVKDNLQIQPKDLVYNMMRMWQGAIGLSYWIGMVSPAYVVLRPTKEACSKFFINLFDRSRSLYLFWAYSYGITNDRLRLYYKDFASIPLAIPTIPEQQRIASFLSVMDKKIEKLTRKEELLETYKKGVMQQIFSRETRFSGFEGEWKTNKLGDISERVMVGLATSVTAYYTEKKTDSVPIIRNLNIKNGFFDDSDMLYLKADFSKQHPNKRVKKNDVITVHTGSNVCLTCVVPEKYDKAQTFTTLIVTTKSNVLSPHYLSYLLSSKYGKYQALRLVVGGGKGNLNTNDFKIYPVSYPSVREQKKITNFLSSIDKKIKAVQTQLTQTQAFKKGLLQKMFV